MRLAPECIKWWRWFYSVSHLFMFWHFFLWIDWKNGGIISWNDSFQSGHTVSVYRNPQPPFLPENGKAFLAAKKLWQFRRNIYDRKRQGNVTGFLIRPESTIHYYYLILFSGFALLYLIWHQNGILNGPKINFTIKQYLGLHSQRLFEQVRIESNWLREEMLEATNNFIVIFNFEWFN